MWQNIEPRACLCFFLLSSTALRGSRPSKISVHVGVSHTWGNSKEGGQRQGTHQQKRRRPGEYSELFQSTESTCLGEHQAKIGCGMCPPVLEIVVPFREDQALQLQARSFVGTAFPSPSALCQPCLRTQACSDHVDVYSPGPRGSHGRGQALFKKNFSLY